MTLNILMILSQELLMAISLVWLSVLKSLEGM